MIHVEIRAYINIVSHVVDVAAADVWEEVLIGEGVVGRRDAISSRA
jgi:hypothetical protein